MKITLPVIGEVRTGADAIEKQEKLVTSELGAAFLNLSGQGVGDVKTVSDKLLRSFEGWVYANVSALAEEVSKMEFQLYRTKMVRGEFEFVEVPTSPLLDLLDRFNPYTTTSDAMYMVEAHLELAGDTFLLLDNPNKPTTMFILEPDKVTVNPGTEADGYEIASYTYRTTIDGKTIEKVYEADYVIQIKNPNPNNPLRGKSVVEAAAQTIDTDVLASEYLKVLFRNGVVPNFALSSDQRITKDDIKRIAADLKANYGGARNAFKTLILGGGLKPVSVQQTNRETQFLEIETAMRDKIMALFKNTKSSLGIVEDVNRANAEASLLGWKQSVIKPKMQRIVDTLNEFLVPRFGRDLILTFKDPVPENREGKVEEVAKLMSTNVTQTMTVNEARAMLDLDPLPGGEFDTLASAPTAEVPKALTNISLTKHLRRNGWYEQKEMFDLVKKSLRNRIKTKPVIKVAKDTDKPEVKWYRNFTNEQARDYWQKQIQITEVIEARFKDKIDKFLEALEDKAIRNLHKQTKSKKQKAFDLFNEQDEIQAGVDLFTPLTQQIAELSGSEAYQLLNVASLYNPSTTLKQEITRRVDLFVHSFVGTDKEQLTAILTEALQRGDSVPQIERAIREKFGDFRKMQSTRLARTEVLNASNAGALDAFRESGVVEGKQWLTSPGAEEMCANLNGVIRALDANFYDISTEFENGDPPLHPNCRCVLLPVLANVEAHVDDSKEKLQQYEQEIKETKEYASELEQLLDKANGE